MNEHTELANAEPDTECRQNHGRTESSRENAFPQDASVMPWFCLPGLRAVVLCSLRPFLAVRRFCSWLPGSAAPRLSPLAHASRITHHVPCPFAPLCTTLHYFAVILNAYEH